MAAATDEGQGADKHDGEDEDKGQPGGVGDPAHQSQHPWGGNF